MLYAVKGPESVATQALLLPGDIGPSPGRIEAEWVEP